jgi:small-conductance mechanosensitive channel
LPEIPAEAAAALQHLTWQRGLIAAGVFVAFLLVAKLASALVRRRLTAGAQWGGPIFALSKLLSYFLVFIGFVTALSLLGVPLSSLLLTSSALLIGIGFSLQHVARDFIAGIIILVEQPIRRGDFVTFGEKAGTVQEIGLRATHLLTPDGTDLVVPNHLLVTTEVSNHSHPLPRARLSVVVPVSLREDVDEVCQILVRVARSHAEVLSDPPPIVRIDDIRESEFRFHLIVWVRDPPTTLRISSELRFGIARAFAWSGVRFPTPELRLHPRGEPSPQTVTPEPEPDFPLE